jgi:hypothetical protein
MGKRILDYPITQDIDDNDYVLLDGVNGTRKIQAKKLQGGDAPDPSEYNYTWFSNPEKTLVVRVTNATGFFKIWFEGIVVDDNSTGQFRWQVPANLNPYALQKNTIAVAATIFSPTLGDNLGGRAGFEYVNGTMYVYLNITGHSSQKLAGTIKQALMYSTDTGNSQNHLDDWSEPTFDPING